MRRSERGSERRSAIAPGRARLHYLDVGTGELIVVLQNSSEQPALVERLAEQFRVIAFQPNSEIEPSKAAADIDQVAANLAVTGYSVIAGLEHARAGIALATSCADRVNALVLIAPDAELLAEVSDPNGVAANVRLDEITAPTLALFGTLQGAPAFEFGRTLARSITKCFYTLVYDSGCAIGIDRPQALVTLVLDFMKWKDSFVVGHHGSEINP
jgi:pimeloyl-ACP methyl ester carboxylesterase